MSNSHSPKHSASSHSTHPYLAHSHSISKSSKSASFSEKSRSKTYHHIPSPMAITDSNTAHRMAIQTLLNDTRDDSRPGASRSSAKDYQCDLCPKSFTQRADVRKHKKTVHEKARDFHCQECNLSFGERGNLNKHVRSIHRRERNFFCDQCDATFPFRNGLTEHKRMKHTDERPFECNRCTSTFKKKSHLHRHLTLVHKVSAWRCGRPFVNDSQTILDTNS